MNFKMGNIKDIIIKDLIKNTDSRGWLIELFRNDEIDDHVSPVMSYISMTNPGIVRGPHEHIEQTDYFCFVGFKFRLMLWDNRRESDTYLNKMILEMNDNDHKIVIVPPGIVHVYKNIGKGPGCVFNFPNRLYAGPGKKDKVDEIRYENDPNSPFNID